MAVDSDSSVRQRKLEKDTEDTQTPAPAVPAKKEKKIKSGGGNTESRWVDVARTLTLLFAISCGLSYLVSSGESFFWSMKVPPKYLRREWWQSQIVSPTNLHSHIWSLGRSLNLICSLAERPQVPYPRRT